MLTKKIYIIYSLKIEKTTGVYELNQKIRHPIQTVWMQFKIRLV